MSERNVNRNSDRLVTSIFILLVLAVNLSSENEHENPEFHFPDFKHANTEDILTWDQPASFKRDFPYYLSGFDHDGDPIWIAEIGKWDAGKYMERGHPEEIRQLKKYVIQMFKRCSAPLHLLPELNQTDVLSRIRKVDDGIHEFNYLLDVDGFSAHYITHPQTSQLKLWIARQAEQAFTGPLKHAFIVNSNLLFSSIWQVLTPLLGKDVYKVQIFGTNTTEWIPKVLKYFPREQLPAWYGGSEDHKPLLVYR